MSKGRPTLADWLRAEPFSLALSSGFFGFFAHCGMLEALLEAGLTPRAISGSSAGALVGGLWAAGVEVGTLGEELCHLRRADFWDPWPGFGLLRGRLFREQLERLAPVGRFEDCRVKLSVSAFDVFARRTRVVSAGPLVPAIQASCSVPFLFQPTWLDGRPYLDGAVKDRPALAAFPEGARVLSHHLLPRGLRDPDRVPPARVGLTAVVIHDLPRVHPFALDVGRHALRAAREAMRRALVAPAAPVVEVAAG